VEWDDDGPGTCVPECAIRCVDCHHLRNGSTPACPAERESRWADICIRRMAKPSHSKVYPSDLDPLARRPLVVAMSAAESYYVGSRSPRPGANSWWWYKDNRVRKRDTAPMWYMASLR